MASSPEVRHQYYLTHGEYIRSQVNQYRQEHGEEIKLKKKQYYANNKREIKSRLMMKTYGISMDEYNAMFDMQLGCCAICGRHQSEFKRAFAVDHNHETGKVRGLLCINCNKALGLFKDSIDLLVNAIDYLESRKEIENG